MEDESRTNAPAYEHYRRDVLGQRDDGTYILGERREMGEGEGAGLSDAADQLQDLRPTTLDKYNPDALSWDALVMVRQMANRARESGGDDPRPVWLLRRDVIRAGREIGVVVRD